MIKLCWIKTGIENPLVTEWVGIPLGLMYLTSALREWSDYRFEFKLVDMRLDKIDSAYLCNEIISFSPDLIGISSMTS